MISVIISSADQRLLKTASANIEQTIGVPFEIISTENSSGEKGICEVYNNSASKAKYDLLCFMHEDVEIKTQDWGSKVLAQFAENPDWGVLGVAGSAYKTFAPSGWDVQGNEGEVRCIHYIQSYKSEQKPSELIKMPRDQTGSTSVVAVDGMWFCTLKKIVKTHPFDQSLLTGFHGYDLDFCLSLYPYYKVMVTYEVLMEHLSEGSFNKQWFGEILRIHQKRQHLLPAQTRDVSKKHQEIFEKRAWKTVLAYFFATGFRKKEVLKQLREHRSSGKIGLALFLKLSFYVLKQ